MTAFSTHSDSAQAPDGRRGHPVSGPARIARRLAGAALAAVLMSLIGASVALADNVTVTPTSVTAAPANGSTPLTGTTISGYSDPSESLLVSVSTTIGSLSMSETSGLSLSFGYSTFSGSSFSFTGDQADVQNGLASLSLSDSGTTGTAAVTVNVTANAAGLAYLPSTGHYYEYVPDSNVLWTTAETDATALSFDGQPGYLASIPNATVNSFIEAHIQNASNVWAGGMSVDYPSGYDGNSGIQRVWSWQGGPLAGTIFTECTLVSGSCVHTNDSGDYYDWNSGEPNNSGYASGTPGSGEHYLEINYLGEGIWNDIPNSTTIAGYVVEFGSGAPGGGFSGDYSGTADITLSSPPDAPTGVSATGGTAAGGQATISWTAPVNNGGATITGYTVTAAPGGLTCTTTGATTCAISGLTNGQSYTFTVTAANSQGNSVASSASSATRVSGTPGAPTAVSATPAPASATVSWTAPSGNGAAITGYTVTASPGGETCLWTSGPAHCTVTGLTNGTPYTFTVTATNANATGAPSAASSAVTPLDVPGAPTGVSASAWTTPGGLATISWTAPVITGGTAITGYTVTASPGGLTCTTTGATTCAITGLTNGQSYTFTVTAANSQGNSVASSASSSTLVLELPHTPAIATPADQTDTNVTEPAFSGTADPGDTVTVMLNGSPLGTTTADGSGLWTFTPSAPISDGTYTVTATATDAYSNVSPASSGRSLTIDTVAPAAPTVTSPANGSVSNDVSPTIAVSGEPGANVTVAVDGVDYGPVTLDQSGNGLITIPGPLSAGQHTVAAQQTDQAGNVGPWSVASIITVKLSTTVTLTGPTGSPTNATTPTVSYAGEPGDSYVITVDGETVLTGVIPAGGAGAITLPTALADGAHTIAITVTDAAGNQATDSIVVTIDTAAPGAVSVDQAPATMTNSTAATFSFSDAKAGVSYQCSLDGAAWSPCPDPVTFAGLDDGSHALLVRALDAAGNLSVSTQYAWTVDTTPPAAPVVMGGPAAYATPGPASFDLSPAPGTTLECSLDGGPFEPCPATYRANATSLGGHTLSVVAVDEAGNTSAPTVYHWTVVRRTGPRGLPRTARLLVAATATAAAGRSLDVGCDLNAGSVRRCAVALYHDGVRIGSGTTAHARAGVTHAIVAVTLNATGRRLLARALGGLTVSLRATARPIGFGALRAIAHTVLYPPLRYVVRDVLFVPGAATFTAAARAAGEAIARQLAGARTVVCEGNTDSIGSWHYNYELGLRRAQAVCGMLRALGVDAHFSAVSYGYERPVASNATAAGRALNRRVVIRVSYYDLPRADRR